MTADTSAVDPEALEAAQLALQTIEIESAADFRNNTDLVASEAIAAYLAALPRPAIPSSVGVKPVALLALMKQCGYDGSLPHPDAYKNFSYARLAELISPAQSPVEAQTEVQDALFGCAQLLDTIALEWSKEGAWSEWDQSIRDKVGRLLFAFQGITPPEGQKYGTASAATLTRQSVIEADPATVEECAQVLDALAGDSDSQAACAIFTEAALAIRNLGAR